MSDTANFSHDDMVRKVAALLATAQSFASEGNEEAASSYIQKAHTLQQKYSIDQAMVAERTGVATEKIISKHLKVPGTWGKRKVTLAHVIAVNTQCTGYYMKYGKGYEYIVFGFESDVEHVEYLFNSLCIQMDQAHARAVAFSKPSWEHGKTFGASFMNGFISVIGPRLREAAEQAKAEASGDSLTGAQSVALVLVSKKAKVEEEMKAQVGNLGRGSASRTNSASAYRAGQSAGRSATIARGSVGSSSKGSLGR